MRLTMGILTMIFISWFFSKISDQYSMSLYAAASLLFDAVSFSIAVAYSVAAILSVLLVVMIGLDFYGEYNILRR